MELADFKIGNWFQCGDNKWYVLDRGQRTIVAIKEGQRAKAIAEGCWSWDEMLPFATIFDPFDMEACDETKI